MLVLFDQGSPVPLRQWPLLALHVDRIADAVDRATAGTYAEVDIAPA